MAYIRSKMATYGMAGKKHKGPLRKVVNVKRFAESLFDTDWVVFECGHEGRRSIGAIRGRCGLCGRSKQKHAQNAEKEGTMKVTTDGITVAQALARYFSVSEKEAFEFQKGLSDAEAIALARCAAFSLGTYLVLDAGRCLCGAFIDQPHYSYCPKAGNWQKGSQTGGDEND